MRLAFHFVSRRGRRDCLLVRSRKELREAVRLFDYEGVPEVKVFGEIDSGHEISGTINIADWVRREMS